MVSFNKRCIGSEVGSIFSGHLLIPASGLFLDLNELCELWQQFGACLSLAVRSVSHHLSVLSLV